MTGTNGNSMWTSQPRKVWLWACVQPAGVWVRDTSFHPCGNRRNVSERMNMCCKWEKERRIETLEYSMCMCICVCVCVCACVLVMFTDAISEAVCTLGVCPESSKYCLIRPHTETGRHQDRFESNAHITSCQIGCLYLVKILEGSTDPSLSTISWTIWNLFYFIFLSIFHLSGLFVFYFILYFS